MYLAAKNSHDEVICYLIEHGARKVSILHSHCFLQCMTQHCNHSSPTSFSCDELVLNLNMDTHFGTSHSFTMSGVIHNGTFQECNIQGTFDCLESAIRQNKDQFQYFKAKMQQFEQQGCNTKKLFRDCKTPLLHCAVAAGLVEMVEKLVALGAGESVTLVVPYSS